MTNLLVLLAGIFLPLFPLSMLFNLLYARVPNPAMRGLLLLAWPQIGLAILFAVGVGVPTWLLAWGLLTSLLYALRALALRELGLWTSFVATSAWSLLWILYAHGATAIQLCEFTIGISIPLLLLATLGAGLERRFGAAYLGLYGGLAQTIPRFTGVLVVVVLAVVATPVFPTFFAMLALIIKSTPLTPLIAIGVGLVWLLWSWAGARLLQGLITGSGHGAIADLSKRSMWLYILVLAALVFTGVYWSGAVA
jgi:hypothetical protein